MWSRAFLSAGVCSGSLFACLALAGIWWVTFVATGAGYPNWANITAFGIIGIPAYPVCWYFFIYRSRDYSARRTWLLIAATYAGVCAIAVGTFVSAMLYHAVSWIALAPNQPLVWLSLFGPFIALIFASIVAGLVGIAYGIVATPIAFLHRFALLRMFGTGGRRQ